MRNIRQIQQVRGFTLIDLGVAIAIIAVLGLAANQTASLNVVFLPAVQNQADVELPAVQRCTVSLGIFDRDGNTLASSTETLSANQSRSLIYPPSGDPTAVELHALVGVPTCPDNAASCSQAQKQAQQHCRNQSSNFAASLEIIDNVTGKTVVALPAVQLNGQAAEGQQGRF